MFHVGYTILKVFHVFFAVAWVGGSLFNIAVVQRSLTQATSATRRELAGRLFPSMIRFFNVVGGLTLLSGVGLVYMHPHGIANLTADLWGKLVVFAAVATLAALYLAGTSIRSTFKAIQKAMGSLPPGEEVPGNVRFLMVRMQVTSSLILALLLVVLVLMVWANQSYWGPH